MASQPLLRDFNTCTGNADPVQSQQCIDDCTAQPTGALCIEAHACTSAHCATECA
jgi:hypothetical protein